MDTKLHITGGMFLVAAVLSGQTPGVSETPQIQTKCGDAAVRRFG